MIDWKKYFDHIYCIHYLPYKERYRKCVDELTRVGIRESGIFSWKLTWDSPLFDKLYQVCNFAPSVGCMKIGFAHYMCIKEAYELGFKHILILENDNIFLKDVNKIEKILNDLPDDYDICLLDKIPAINAKYEDAVKNATNESFIDIDKKFYVLANCYALSRKGMEHIIKSQEKTLAISDTYLRFPRPLCFPDAFLCAVRFPFSVFRFRPGSVFLPFASRVRIELFFLPFVF